MDCLCNKVKPLAVLFWALGIVLANTWPLYAGMASLPRRTKSMSLYGHATCMVVEIFFTLNYQRRLVGPPFSLSRFFIHSIYGWNLTRYSYADFPECSLSEQLPRVAEDGPAAEYIFSFLHLT